MAVLKCKMCGGDLNFEEGATVVECEYCGTKQTVPTIDDEKKITLFGRANRLRFACEFDKASGVYESIVADFPEEAEAYWGLVLCKYGIEYVDDPATGKKIPTCHRSSFESVMEDDNFDQVMENADPIARSVYRDEAKQIEELRRGIIEVSNKEEPYDIFICYKETAENGERTIDSVIAQDVYHELTEKGYRVFFSRITLEDKLGQEYEPYIFAALNSAEIMLAFGTDYEYYNAVWVKNEWSRFLQLIAKGEKKTLIPCYKNIDAYDMPKEFARLQAQDMGKVGAMQDLLRGIEKLLPRKESEQAVQAQQGKEIAVMQQLMVDFWLKGMFTYLEDGKWDNAVDYCNRVLEISPENVEAHVGLLMADLQVRREMELAKQMKSFGQNKHFIKAIRFAREERRKVLEGYSQATEDYIAEQLDVLLKQAFMYLENGDWSNAADCCNRVLDMSSENADAYVGLLMADMLVRKEGELVRQTRSFGQNEHFLKAVQFAGEERRKVLEGYSKAVEDYIAEEKKKQEEEKQRQEEEKQRQEEEKRRQEKIHCQQLVEKRQSLKKVSGLISIWEYVTAVLCSDGTVLFQDEHNFGYTYDTKHWRDIVAVAAGGKHIIGLKSNGTVVATGNNKEGQCNVQLWKDVIAVAAGEYHTVGLKSDGTVVVASTKYEFEVSHWRDIVAVAAGSTSVVGLKSDGTVVVASTKYIFEVSHWRDIVAVAAGSTSIVGLKSDSTVVAAKPSTFSDSDVRNVSSWTDIVAVAAGIGYILGLKLDGTVVIGDNMESNGTAFERNNFVLAWGDIVAVDVSREIVGLRSNGTVVSTSLKYKSGNRLFNSLATLEQEFAENKARKQVEDQRANLCQHCGGEFKGLLTKICSVCGKPKDY